MKYNIESYVKKLYEKGLLKEYIINYLVNKVINLRIFPDENNIMNKSLLDRNSSVLSVSQFTLYADCRRGNRPSFVNAAPPAMAEDLYDYLLEECAKSVETAGGEFGADMKVSLINNGPFTIVLDSADLK